MEKSGWRREYSIGTECRRDNNSGRHTTWGRYFHAAAGIRNIRRQYSGRRKYIHRNNAASGGSSSGGGSSADSSSSSGGGAPAENTTPSGGNGSSNPSGGTAGTPSTGTDSGGNVGGGNTSGGSSDTNIPSGGSSGSSEVPAVHRTVGHLLVVEIVIVIQETLVQALPVVMAKTLDGQMIFYKRIVEIYMYKASFRKPCVVGNV